MEQKVDKQLATILKVKDEYIADLTPRDYTITLGLIGSSDPHVVVKINNAVYFDGYLPNQLIEFKFTVTNKNKRQMLNIIFDNKMPGDTVLDSDGNFLKDKTVEIAYVKFDNVIIRNYIYKSKFTEYQTNKKYYANKIGFNGVWKLAYANPPLLHMAKYSQSLFDNDSNKKELRNKYFAEIAEFFK